MPSIVEADVRPPLQDYVPKIGQLITVLGSSRPDWSRDYVVDFGALVSGRPNNRSFSFGGIDFSARLAAVRENSLRKTGLNSRLRTFVYDGKDFLTEADQVSAASIAMRANADFLIFERFRSDAPLVPLGILTHLYRSGFPLAGGMVVETQEALFAQVAANAGIPEDDYQWVTGSQRPVVVFFEGRNVTEAYSAWLRGRVPASR